MSHPAELATEPAGLATGPAQLAAEPADLAAEEVELEPAEWRGHLGYRAIPYGDAVRARPDGIDREAWASVIQDLMQEHGMSQTALATAVGVAAKTVQRWQRQAVDVSEESVRQVARALGYRAMDLLIRVGYYRSEDAVAGPADNWTDEPVLERLRSLLVRTDVPQEVKEQLREQLAMATRAAARLAQSMGVKDVPEPPPARRTG